MLRHHLLIALRSLRRRKGFAALSVTGLAVGLGCALLIALFVMDELGHDRAFAGRNVHRLVSDIQQSGDAEPHHVGAVGWPYGRIIEETFPEVEDVVYLGTWPAYPITQGDERLHERMLWADEGFFEAFPVALGEGDPATALAEPFSVVLSEALARRLYGDGPALGRTLTLADTLDFTVSGVAAEGPPSHVTFDVLGSFGTMRALLGSETYDAWIAGGWLNVNAVNYVRLRDGADAAALARKVRDLPMERAGETLRGWGSTYRLGLQPAEDVYLRAGGYDNPLGPQGDGGRVLLLAAIGAFILLLAGINFVNLATARSAERAREVGVRKVVGSGRGLLIRQFLAESVVTALAALVLALGLATVTLGLFNDLTGKGYGLADLFAPPLLLGALGAAVLVGLLAGLYPAFVLASFRPVAVLKGRFQTGRRGVALRRGLVTFQFAVSCVLIVATLVVLGQLRHMQEQDLGFAEDQVLLLDARDAPFEQLRGGLDGLAQALEAHPAVERTARAWSFPGQMGWRGQVAFPEGWPEGESLALEYVPVGFGYEGALGLEVVAGRAFDRSFATDTATAVVINEAAVRAAGWASAEEAVGKGFASPASGRPEGRVVGVVRDYHHHGLQEAIGPMMFGADPVRGGRLAVRFRAEAASDVLTQVEDAWPRFFPDTALDHAFLDETFAAQYEAERRLARTFGVFSALAVLVACLGLFGLAAYVAARRTKEVGVRKVLGASVAGLVALLTREFLVLVAVGLAVAVPVAYVLMGRWLDGFAYPAALGPGPFLLAGLLALAIALVAVGGQALRAATADPVQSLRSE